MGVEKEYELKVYLTQEEDCCQPSSDGDYQELTIEHHNGGGGVFYTISTRRWAFETPEELMEQVNEFVNQFKKLNEEVSKSKSG